MNGPWRVALRLARRDLGAHRLRTALTATLIGLPVLFAAVLTALVLSPDDMSFALAIYVPLSLLIVLFAVPAFGVTVRTRRDQLALIESTGGTVGDQRRVVAATGLVIGLLGVLGALVLAVPAWLAIEAVLNPMVDGQVTSVDAEGLVFWPLLAAFAITSSVIAAVVTAVNSTAEPGRAAATPSRAVFAGGVAIAALGLVGLLSVRGDAVAVAPWTTLLGLGASLMVPTLVHAVSRVASRLPIALRLSARDADRHRSRTAPAIAAVMVGVAAVTALGIGSASDNVGSRYDNGLYRLEMGSVSVYGEQDAVTRAIAAAPDGVTLVGLPLAGGEDRSVSLPFSQDPGPMPTQAEAVVADADTLAAWGLRLDAESRAELAGGRALVGPEVALTDGQVRAESFDEDGVRIPLDFPASRADLSLGPVPDGPRPRLASAVIPPELAEQLRLTTMVRSAIVDRRGENPTAAQLAALRALPGSTVEIQKEVSNDEYRMVLSLLTLLGLGIVGLATATSVALARVDGREDATTLVSVGARPSTSRWTAAISALLIGGVGSLLGVAVGLVPGIRAGLALTGNFGEEYLAIPWSLLAIVGLGIPAVVALIAYATANTKQPQPTEGLR